MKRQQWLAMLAKLTAPMDSTTAAQAFVAYLPMLTDFPDEAFCPASLDAVATQCGYAPSYGALAKGVGRVVEAQHRPPSAAIEAIPPPAQTQNTLPTISERAAVSRSVREILTGFSEVTRQREAQLPQHITRPLPQFSREAAQRIVSPSRHEWAASAKPFARAAATPTSTPRSKRGPPE